MIKKSWWGVLILLGIVLSSSFTMAQTLPFDIRGGANMAISALQDVFGPILEVLLGVNQFDKFFFAKILLLALIYAIVYVVLKKVEMLTPAMVAVICLFIRDIISRLSMR